MPNPQSPAPTEFLHVSGCPWLDEAVCEHKVPVRIAMSGGCQQRRGKYLVCTFGRCRCRACACDRSCVARPRTAPGRTHLLKLEERACCGFACGACACSFVASRAVGSILYIIMDPALGAPCRAARRCVVESCVAQAVLSSEPAARNPRGAGRCRCCSETASGKNRLQYRGLLAQSLLNPKHAKFVLS